MACVEWLAPLMAAGNWIPELVEIAGGRNLLGAAGVHSPWLQWDELTSSDPDVVVLMPCGFDVERTLQEATALRTNDCWRELRAVRQGRVLRRGRQPILQPSRAASRGVRRSAGRDPASGILSTSAIAGRAGNRCREGRQP